MRKILTRLAVGALLFLLALMPLAEAVGRQPQLPQYCTDLLFSTEEDFLTQGPTPSDGNPIISDGDLLGLEFGATGVNCAVCARNADLLQNFNVGVDLGLDAVDLVDSETFLIAFSTELNSPNDGQFTHGDLLVTNGAIIPNQALTFAFEHETIEYDLGLDAVLFIGEADLIKGFLVQIEEITRQDWLQDPGSLSRMLAEAGLDLWFSTEGTWTPPTKPGFLDGDLLSARDGTIVASNSALLPLSVPAGIPNRGVDFGLDAASNDRSSDKQSLQFSTEIRYQDDNSFTDGDVLKYADGIIYRNSTLLKCFIPKSDFLGLDAYHLIRQPYSTTIYLPLVYKTSPFGQ
jgi:hypothetical protein